MIFVGDHFKEDGDWIWTSFCATEKYLLGIVADGRGKAVCDEIGSDRPCLGDDGVDVFSL